MDIALSTRYEGYSSTTSTLQEQDKYISARLNLTSVVNEEASSKSHYDIDANELSELESETIEQIRSIRLREHLPLHGKINISTEPASPQTSVAVLPRLGADLSDPFGTSFDCKSQSIRQRKTLPSVENGAGPSTKTDTLNQSSNSAGLSDKLSSNIASNMPMCQYEQSMALNPCINSDVGIEVWQRSCCFHQEVSLTESGGGSIDMYECLPQKTRRNHHCSRSCVRKGITRRNTHFTADQVRSECIVEGGEMNMSLIHDGEATQGAKPITTITACSTRATVSSPRKMHYLFKNQECSSSVISSPGFNPYSSSGQHGNSSSHTSVDTNEVKSRGPHINGPELHSTSHALRIPEFKFFGSEISNLSCQSSSKANNWEEQGERGDLSQYGWMDGSGQCAQSGAASYMEGFKLTGSDPNTQNSKENTVSMSGLPDGGSNMGVNDMCPNVDDYSCAPEWLNTEFGGQTPELSSGDSTVDSLDINYWMNRPPSKIKLHRVRSCTNLKPASIAQYQQHFECGQSAGRQATSYDVSRNVSPSCLSSNVFPLRSNTLINVEYTKLTSPSRASYLSSNRILHTRPVSVPGRIVNFQIPPSSDVHRSGNANVNFNSQNIQPSVYDMNSAVSQVPDHLSDFGQTSCFDKVPSHRSNENALKDGTVRSCGLVLGDVSTHVTLSGLDYTCNADTSVRVNSDLKINFKPNDHNMHVKRNIHSGQILHQSTELEYGDFQESMSGSQVATTGDRINSIDHEIVTRKFIEDQDTFYDASTDISQRCMSKPYESKAENDQVDTPANASVIPPRIESHQINGVVKSQSIAQPRKYGLIHKKNTEITADNGTLSYKKSVHSGELPKDIGENIPAKKSLSHVLETAGQIIRSSFARLDECDCSSYYRDNPQSDKKPEETHSSTNQKRGNGFLGQIPKSTFLITFPELHKNRDGEREYFYVEVVPQDPSERSEGQEVKNLEVAREPMQQKKESKKKVGREKKARKVFSNPYYVKIPWQKVFSESMEKILETRDGFSELHSTTASPGQSTIKQSDSGEMNSTVGPYFASHEQAHPSTSAPLSSQNEKTAQPPTSPELDNRGFGSSEWGLPQCVMDDTFLIHLLKKRKQRIEQLRLLKNVDSSLSSLELTISEFPDDLRVSGSKSFGALNRCFPFVLEAQETVGKDLDKLIELILEENDTLHQYIKDLKIKSNMLITSSSTDDVQSFNIICWRRSHSVLKYLPEFLSNREIFKLEYTSNPKFISSE